MRSSPRARLVGVYALFTLSGVAFASWVSRVPDVRDALDLSPRGLGLLLLCLSVGSITGLTAAAPAGERLGIRRSVALVAAVFALGCAAIGVGVDGVASPWLTGAGLAAFGFANGLLDVVMNLAGAEVEREIGRAEMPRFHAAFSGGTVAAAAVGAACSGGRVPVSAHLAVAGALVCAVILAAVHAFPAHSERPAEHAPTGQARSAWREPRTLQVGLVVLAAAFAEGSANDWLPLAFREGHHQPGWASVLALAVFLAAMTTGRLAGPVVLARHARSTVLRASLALATLGCLVTVFGPTAAAYVGAACWGLGASLGFPMGMSAGADDPRRAAARVSVISTIGYTAFLAGPPLLGFLGDRVGVLASLTVVAGALVSAQLVGRAVDPPAQGLGVVPAGADGAGAEGGADALSAAGQAR